MTEDFTFDRSRLSGTEEYFEPRKQQGHLFIIRVFDVVAPVITKHAPSGYVTRNGQVYANNAVRAAVVDMNQFEADGSLGKCYPEAMIFTGLLVKELKRDVGRTILVTWNQQDPDDKSSPYKILEMSGDPAAVAAARDYLARHPEFMKLPAPPEWDIRMSPPVEAPQYPAQPMYGQQPQWNQPPQYQQQPPQWQPQGPPPQQPQYQQQQGWGPDQGYNQHPPRQPQQGWQGPTAQPQGPPQAAPGSFLEAYAQQRGQQGPPVNHWGQPQSPEPAF